MNALLTHAAEGLDRRAFSVKDVLLMVEAGVLGHDERFELIGGEIVPMSPKGIRHETLKVALNMFLARNLVKGMTVAQETTFYLSDDTFIEPDFVIYPSGELASLSPENCLLAIEVADSSLNYDLGRKTELYARFGIAELWVINALTRDTRIHRDPNDGQYQSTADHAAGTKLSTPRVPGIEIDLAQMAS